MSDNMPDFDRMSQDEIMAWMESLAKRQGAVEGFTTDADVEIAEIDPETVTIDEPGYVPYSEGRGSKAAAQTPAPPPAPPRPEPPAPAPAPSVPVMRPVPPPPSALPPAPRPQPPAPPAPEPAQENSALAWLESLAANQNEDLFNLDLSSLEASAPADAPPPVAVNPQAWLQDLARAQGELSGEGPQEGDTLEWLESLAVRQGADRDEMITPAELQVPPPEADAEAPAYSPFSFETAASTRGSFTLDPMPGNPASFLSSLSAESGYSEAGVLATQPRAEEEAAPPDEDVMDALAQGTVTPEQMQAFMERQMDRALETPEAALPDDYDPDAPPVKAELPDWLLEQVGAPPAPDAPRDLPPLESILPPLPEEAPALDLSPVLEEPGSEAMPDWLAQAVAPMPDDSIIGDIFERDPQIDAAAEALGVSAPADPWAEAFDNEYFEGTGDVNNPPDWYLRNVEAAERQSQPADRIPAEALSDAPLPDELDLPPGTPEPLPLWLQAEPEVEELAVEITEPAAAAPAETDEEMPAWITAEVVAEPEPTPWWEQTVAPDLNATIQFDREPEPEPVFVPSAPPAPAPEPARPLFRPAARIDAPALDRARQHRQTGDLSASLAEYEALVRENVAVDSVVDDLADLVHVHRDNPTVYRVLGDGYMRQGKLQQALDIYREALNLL